MRKPITVRAYRQKSLGKGNLSPNLLATFSFPKILADFQFRAQNDIFLSPRKEKALDFRCYESWRRHFTQENSSFYSNLLQIFKMTKAEF